jgi:hypothetical protein
MMNETVSDFLLRRLSEWSVKRIFGYPGDDINGIMGALSGHYQQEVKLVSLFGDVAHEYVQMIIVPAQARHVVDRVMRRSEEVRKNRYLSTRGNCACGLS